MVTKSAIFVWQPGPETTLNSTCASAARTNCCLLWLSFTEQRSKPCNALITNNKHCHIHLSNTVNQVIYWRKIETLITCMIFAFLLKPCDKVCRNKHPGHFKISYQSDQFHITTLWKTKCQLRLSQRKFLVSFVSQGAGSPIMVLSNSMRCFLKCTAGEPSLWNNAHANHSCTDFIIVVHQIYLLCLHLNELNCILLLGDLSI